jgi:hypothetical protein
MSTIVLELIKMDLRVLQESAGKTQAALAELTKLAQSELSKIDGPGVPHGLELSSRDSAVTSKGLLRRQAHHSPRRLNHQRQRTPG